MTIPIILIVYITGFLIAFGITTWLQYMYEEPLMKIKQPLYQKAWHNKLTLIVSGFSWLGVMLAIYTSFSFHRGVGIHFSYKRLWSKWLKAHYKI